MSVGCFLGIRVSFLDKAQAAASAYLAAIDQVLSANGLPGYKDPLESPYTYGGLFGRSQLDHHGALSFFELANCVTESSLGTSLKAPHLGLLSFNPYRVAFVPVDFEDPLLTSYAERINLKQTFIWVGSLPRLFAELSAVALPLGIPLERGRLSDGIARKINDCTRLTADDDDDVSLREDLRTAWLVLYEGARLALQHSVALSLAG